MMRICSVLHHRFLDWSVSETMRHHKTLHIRHLPAQLFFPAGGATLLALPAASSSTEAALAEDDDDFDVAMSHQPMVRIWESLIPAKP